MSETATILTRPDQTRPDQTRPLVSVIVPVYNVEKYLPRCLDSILAQTYTNLEILVIDDGSTDSSGKICDDYALRDSRIQVTHQANKGLSGARNTGLRLMKGDYIQCIDSDDWINPETIETCLRYAKEYDAEIVKFSSVIENEDGSQKRGFKFLTAPKLMTSQEALSLYFFYPTGLSACSKLVKAELFRDIFFPEGKISEDIFIMCKVIARANRFLSLPDVFYHYFMRSTSITHAKFSAKSYDGSEAALYAYKFITENYALTKYEHMNLSVGLCSNMLGLVNSMTRANTFDYEYISNLRRRINILDVLRCRYIRPLKKAQLLIIKLSPFLYKILYKRLKPKR